MTDVDQYVFRVATPSDATQIAALIQAAFRAEDNGVDWIGDHAELNRTYTMSPEEVLSTIEKPGSAFLMATSADESLVAAVATTKRNDELARIAYLVVDQTCQRGGLGLRTLSNAEEYVRKTWNVKKIGLNALSTRSLLIKWYERRGYVQTGEKTPFPIQAFRSLKLPEDLHFVEMEKEALAFEPVVNT